MLELIITEMVFVNVSKTSLPLGCKKKQKVAPTSPNSSRPVRGQKIKLTAVRWEKINLSTVRWAKSKWPLLGGRR